MGLELNSDLQSIVNLSTKKAADGQNDVLESKDTNVSIFENIENKSIKSIEDFNSLNKKIPDDIINSLLPDISDDIDANGDGIITQEEYDNYNKTPAETIKEFLGPKIEIDGKNVSISKLDTDGDGVVTEEEIQNYKDHYSKDDISDKLDLDGDGKITKKEVERYNLMEKIKKWFNEHKLEKKSDKGIMPYIIDPNKPKETPEPIQMPYIIDPNKPKETPEPKLY